jgi:hypothetical protein
MSLLRCESSKLRGSNWIWFFQGRVEAVNPFAGMLEKMTGTPWSNSLKEKGFNVEEAQLTPLFNYLEFCLQQVC